MKKFILKVVLFLLIMAAVDRAIGACFDYMAFHPKGGYVRHHLYITDKTKDDILVFGSSRAMHHYNSAIISDSLKMSCYNCGQDGNGIILNYGQYILLKKRYSPKLILYDVSPDCDLMAREDNHKYLGWLKMQYDKEGIKDIFEAVDKTEPLKMTSKLYRYNYNPLQFLSDYFHPVYHIDATGYVPSGHKELDLKKVLNHKEKDLEIDSLKLSYLHQLMKDIDGKTKVIFIASPIWYGMPEKNLTPFKQLSEQYGCEFVDFANDPKYVHNNKLFNDGKHLNAQGADEFSKDLCGRLKAIIDKNPI